MGLHFQQSSRQRTRMGSQIDGILGIRKFWLVGFKNGKIRGKKKKGCSRTENHSAVDLIFTSRITFRNSPFHEVRSCAS